MHQDLTCAPVLQTPNLAFCLIMALVEADREKERGRARWLMPVIPALWEAEAGGSRGQESETILVNKVKPRLY